MKLKVLTLNCWGVPISSYRKLRMQRIAEKLASSDYDIVALQEVWYTKDWDLIESILKENHSQLKYKHRFRSGAIGSGIAILSKFPIVDLNFQIFNSSGKYYKFWHGDAFAGKGIAHAVISVPELGYIDVYATHTHASYDETHVVQEEYHGVRLSQMIQLGKFVQYTSRNEFALVLGDFNAQPDSYEMKVLKKLSRCRDAFFEASCTLDDGYTCTLNNIFNSSGFFTSMIFPSPDTIFPSRLDYIFYKLDNPFLVKMKILKSAVVFNQDEIQVSKTKFIPCSDHYGVETGFELSKLERSTDSILFPSFLERIESSAVDQTMIQQSICILQESISEAESRRYKCSILKWILILMLCSLEFLMFQYIIESHIQRFIAIIYAIVMVTLFFIFLSVEKSMIPQEISALQESRSHLNMIERQASIILSKDTAMLDIP